MKTPGKTTHTTSPSLQTRITVLEAQMAALLRALEEVTPDTPISPMAFQSIRDLQKDAAT